MSQDGLRIFTKCGNVFRASEIQQQDMTYNGHLSEVSYIEWVEHSSALNKVLVIPANWYYSSTDDDTVVQVYGYCFYNRIGF